MNYPLLDDKKLYRSVSGEVTWSWRRATSMYVGWRGIRIARNQIQLDEMLVGRAGASALITFGEPALNCVSVRRIHAELAVCILLRGHIVDHRSHCRSGAYHTWDEEGAPQIDGGSL